MIFSYILLLFTGLERKIQLAVRLKDKVLKELDTSRKQLNEAMGEITARSDGNMVDKRIVSKLLVTYLDRSNSDDVLEVMCNLIDFTSEERGKVFAFKAKEKEANSGYLSSWFGSSSSATKNATGSTTQRNRTSSSRKASGADNLSDAWVDFLLSEMDETSSGEADHDSADKPSDEIEFIPKISFAESPVKKK